MANIIEIAAQFRQALVDQDGAAIGEMSRRWLAIEPLFQSDVERLVAQIQALKAEGLSDEQIRWRLYRLGTYQSLMAQVAQRIAQFSAGVEPLIDEETGKARELARQHAAGLVEAVTDGRVTVATANLPTGAIENIAAIARAGQPLNKLLENAYPGAAVGITNELIYGVAVGRNPRETARAIIRKGLAPGLNHILLVARDQQIRNYREMTRTVYDRSPVVSGYMRLAAKNKRTCLACLALDGTTYATGEVMALHPQDRCSMVPIVDGFPPPKFQTGEEWFEKQPPSVQREMMGPGRYKAWQDGRFQFGQLATVTDHPTWGPSAQVTSLADLVRGSGGPGAGNGARPAPVEIVTTPEPKRPAAEVARESVVATAKRYATDIEDAQVEAERLRADYRDKFTKREQMAATIYGGDREKARESIVWRAYTADVEDAATAVAVAERRLADIAAERGKALRSALYVDDPANIKVEYVSKFAKTDRRRTAVETGVDEFGALVDRSLIRFALAVKKGGSGRSFFSPSSNDINMTTSAGAGTVIHEMGHWLEHNNATVRQAVHDFYRRRTEGEEVIPLSRATGNVNYRSEERTKVDRFIEPYMGKIYTDRNGKIYATEILSMGLELFYKNPARLAAEDPEYFDFIYNLVRGL